MRFEKTIEIDASPERVWKIVAHEFDRVGEWSSAVQSSSVNAEADAPEGATMGGRVCATDFGELKETFTNYSDDNRQFSFEVDGMPSFITLARNTTRIRPVGKKKAEVRLTTEIETNAIGKVMGPMFAIRLKSTLTSVLDELKAYVEDGELSTRKRRQLARAAA